jgi:hypothetical protein
MQSAPPGLNAMRHMEQCLKALEETSMTASQKLRLLAMVDDFVFGHALRVSAGETPMDIEFAAVQLATGNFPCLAEVFARGPIETGESRFHTGLRLLLGQFDGKSPRPRPKLARPPAKLSK